jgi:hypothetical protein
MQSQLGHISDREPQMSLTRFYTSRRQDHLGRWRHVVLDRENDKWSEFSHDAGEAGRRAAGFNASIADSDGRENSIDIEQPSLTRGGLY